MNRRGFLRLAALAPVGTLTAAAKLPGTREKSSYFTAAEHAALIMNPTSIAALWADNAARFTADLGPAFSAEIEEQRKFGFCGLVAYDLKPYGRGLGVALNELLLAPAIDCDNYCALTWHLFNLLVPQPTITVMVVGVDHGPIGNHAFMMSDKAPDQSGKGGSNWIVDPTVGVIVCGYDLDWVMSGRGVDMNYARSFYWRSDLDAFHARVMLAFERGRHRPSHLLYVTRDLEKFSAPPPMSKWMTPASEGARPSSNHRPARAVHLTR